MNDSLPNFRSVHIEGFGDRISPAGSIQVTANFLNDSTSLIQPWSKLREVMRFVYVGYENARIEAAEREFGKKYHYLSPIKKQALNGIYSLKVRFIPRVYIPPPPPYPFDQ